MAAYVWPLASFTETQHYHNIGPYGGIDIAAPTGTPVMSIADGVVTRIGAQGFGPFYVEIQHPNGVTSYYGHNSAALVAVGDHVKQGQVIARVGSLGISTGPHVHFGVRVNGADANPDSFMAGAIKIESAALAGLHIPNPLSGITDTIKQIIDLFKAVGGFLSWVSKPSNWERVAFFVLGLILLYDGLNGFPTIHNAIQTAKDSAMKVGETAAIAAG